MLIITLRTDKPEAELGLYEGDKCLAYTTWLAHRQLAETIHAKLHELLREHGKDWQDIEGVVVFKGPGSFTGLRIGITVANMLAYSLAVPVVACEDPQWLEAGVQALLHGQSDALALPEYGALPNITLQKK